MVAEACITGHTAYIYDRGGMTRVGQIADIASIRWTRDRDGVSEAQVLLAGRSCANQRRLITSLITKRHELVIFRNGKRVWEGPLWRIGDEGDRVEIVAKDCGQYLFGTPLSKIWDNSYDNDNDVSRTTEVSTRMGDIIEYELTHGRNMRLADGSGSVLFPAWESLDPPVNLVDHLRIHHFPNEAKTAAKTLAFEMTVGEHLQNYARTGGIDYTTVGRSIHIWDTSRSLGRTRAWTEQDFFGNIIVSEYGADHLQGVYVVSQDGVYGEAAVKSYLDLYGPWTAIHDAYNEEAAAPSTAELDSQAKRNTSGRQPAPIEVRVPDNSSVRLGPTLSIDDLVPGAQVPLIATLNSRQWNQLQKIDHVAVEESAEGEEVKITLTPATRVDSDEEEET